MLLGITHLMAMLCFQLGPELAPLVVYFVDYPVCFVLGLLVEFEDERAFLLACLLLCSVLYPIIFYKIARAIILLTTRPHPGNCPECDYDLTGNVSGRCPECGTIIPR